MKAKFHGEPAVVIGMVLDALDGYQGEVEITITDYSPVRTISQNNLYWQWLGVMAAKFTTKKNKFDKNEMHDMMRHKFLGYEDRTIGRTTIEHQLRSTKKLKTGEFFEYMEKVDAWAMDHGVNLPIPGMSQYMMLKEGQDQ
jgi:hypothetical protein